MFDKHLEINHQLHNLVVKENAMNKFKAGDKVYCPKLSRKVLVPQETVGGVGSYPLTISINDTYYYFTIDGKYSSLDEVPSIFHATPENKVKLEQLYGVEFEEPPTKPTSKDIIQAMLARGDKAVPCWVSESDEYPTSSYHWVFIISVSDDVFIDECDAIWKYATPFNPRTCEEITELPT